MTSGLDHPDPMDLVSDDSKDEKKIFDREFDDLDSYLKWVLTSSNIYDRNTM